MGTYYIFVNDTKSEYIDPFYFGDSIKRRGILNGLHAFGMADLITYVQSKESKQINKRGYWSGDRIRVLGDDCEKQYEKVKSNYRDVSFYVLANVFENGTDEIRGKIIMQMNKNKKIFHNLQLVSYEFNYRKLSYQLKSM